MISLACRRVLDTCSSNKSSSSGGGGGSDGGKAGKGKGIVSTSSSSSQLQMALSNLLAAQFNVIDADTVLSEKNKQKNGSVSGGGTSAASSSSSSLPLNFFVSNVFTGPELIPYITGTNCLNRHRLLDEATFCRIADCLVGTDSSSSSSALLLKLDFSSALRFLTNLTSLFTNFPKKGENGSVLSSEDACKRAFSRAADGLVAVLQRNAATKIKNEDINSKEEAIESAVRIFGDGTVALKLQSALELSTFCELYCCLLELTDNSTAAGGGGGGGGRSLRLLSALAFGSGEGKEALLPRLWRWLATTIHLPLEIPAVTTRFEVPSLPLGVHSVSGPAQQPFLLFCRAMTHYLSTADDVEFYEEQGLFTLAAQRALAVGLSTLIFRTHLPLTSPPRPPPLLQLQVTTIQLSNI